MAEIVGESWRVELQTALDGIRSLQASYPGDVALVSAERQLTYLIAIADNVEDDDGALEQITLGYVAMYQLADILSPDMSELLCEISDRVRRFLRQQGRRLKIHER